MRAPVRPSAPHPAIGAPPHRTPTTGASGTTTPAGRYRAPYLTTPSPSPLPHHHRHRPTTTTTTTPLHHHYPHHRCRHHHWAHRLLLSVPLGRLCQRWRRPHQ
eukprot:5901837-Alexandrium_andersonii.AAC.1